jgi:hypothetical protein
LAENYPDDFLGLEQRAQAVVIKALLAHRATIPFDARALVEEVFNPAHANGGRVGKRHIRRLYGLGVPAVDETMACITNRATLWGAGSLGAGDAVNFSLPLPVSLSGRPGLRHFTVTLAWLTPIKPGRNVYRTVRLTVEEPNDLQRILTKSVPGQTDRRTAERGTLFHRQWQGAAARRFADGEALIIPVVRKLDPNVGDELPELIPFGLAVSFETQDQTIPVYDEVRAAVAIEPRVPIESPV